MTMGTSRAAPEIRVSARVNRAFFQVNAVVSVGLFVLVLVQLALN